MAMHPLPAVINHGVPVTLCSDDPSVFGNMGLSFDFFQVRPLHIRSPIGVHMRRRSWLRVKSTVFILWAAWHETASRFVSYASSLGHSLNISQYTCLTEDEKAKAVASWDRHWTKFIAWVIKEKSSVEMVIAVN